jgi:tetratricopeptide (TPR) repeat protein
VEVWFQNTNVIKQGIVYDASFLERIVTAALSCWFYLYKALLPWRVCFVYPRWQLDAGQFVSWLPLTGMIIAAAICWRNRAGWGRPVLAGSAYFVLLIAPALGFAHFYYLRYSLIADHYQYFAIIGLIALAAGGWSQLKQGRIAAAAVVVAALSVISWQQCAAYTDATTLWHDTLKKNPDAWLAHNNLGNILSLEGQWDKALIHHCHVVRLQPNDPIGHNNLGQALAKTHQIPEAIQSYQRALALKPDYATAMNNLGAMYGLINQNDQAELWFRRAIEANPKSADAYDNLGVAMRLKENYVEAERFHRKAIEYDPGKVMARHNLALVLMQLNRAAEAEMQWRQALRVEPNAVLILISLSRLLSARPGDSSQRAAEAVLWASRAVTLTGGRNPRIVSVLGEAYAVVGDWAQAIEATEHALKILPPKDTRFAKTLRDRLTTYRSRASP